MVPRSELAKHVQIVLTDRTELSKGREFGVMSAQTWRIADLFAKHAFLLNGLGWGGMPVYAVKDDLESGRLVELPIEEAPGSGFKLPMSAAYRSDDPPGPAGRWLIERLRERSRAEPETARTSKVTGSRSRKKQKPPAGRQRHRSR
jgi:DNA-binding transcriptional LysR family regulator